MKFSRNHLKNARKIKDGFRVVDKLVLFYRKKAFRTRRLFCGKTRGLFSPGILNTTRAWLLWAWQRQICLSST